jgi:hypothetical protein
MEDGAAKIAQSVEKLADQKMSHWGFLQGVAHAHNVL